VALPCPASILRRKLRGVSFPPVADGGRCGEGCDALAGDAGFGKNVFMSSHPFGVAPSDIVRDMLPPAVAPKPALDDVLPRLRELSVDFAGFWALGLLGDDDDDLDEPALPDDLMLPSRPFM